MYGIIIVVSVDPNSEQEVRNMLVNMIIPKARSHQGIMGGYWLRASEGDVLRTVQLYDTEANAKAVAGQIRSEGPPPGSPVTLLSVNTYDVIAQL